MISIQSRQNIDFSIPENSFLAALSLAIVGLLFLLCSCGNLVFHTRQIPELSHRIGSARELINPNTASIPSLMRLPGIGETKAQAIINYRKWAGPFTSADDLLAVSGMGPVTVERITGFLSFDDQNLPGRTPFDEQ